MKSKTISIFGSTGTVGQKMVDIILSDREYFQPICLTCNHNYALIIQQAKSLHPKYVVVNGDDEYKIVSEALSGTSITVLPGSEICNAAEIDVDIMAMAISGNAGIAPSFSCLGHAKHLALATKEVIVSGGHLFINLAKKNGTAIIPVDSEHNAIYQCLNAENMESVKKIIITCSGGPFVDHSYEDLKNVTISQALQHPTWKMGGKITIDSATMMNKALEIIEAFFLFNILDTKIVEAVIHRQSIIHGMVCFNDGNIKAMMTALPDMKIPIHNAFYHPSRKIIKDLKINFENISNLSFEPFNNWQTDNINLAYTSYSEKKCIAFNMANEYAVNLFLNKIINFIDIQKIICKTLEASKTELISSFSDIVDTMKSIDEINKSFRL